MTLSREISRTGGGRVEAVPWFFFFFKAVEFHTQGIGSLQARVKSELRLSTYATATATADLSSVCDLHHSSRLVLNPLNEARDQTCVLMNTSWFHYC